MKVTGLIQGLITIAALTLALQLTSGCGKKSGVTGAWHGTVDTSSLPHDPGQAANKPIQIVLNISQEGNGLKATISTPEEGPEVVPAETVAFNSPSLTVKIPKRQSVYQLDLNSDGMELRGRFKQGSYDLPLAFKRS